MRLMNVNCYSCCGENDRLLLYIIENAMLFKKKCLLLFISTKNQQIYLFFKWKDYKLRIKIIRGVNNDEIILINLKTVINK